MGENERDAVRLMILHELDLIRQGHPVGDPEECADRILSVIDKTRAVSQRTSGTVLNDIARDLSKKATMEPSNQVVPVSEVQALATTIAVTVAQALIQAKGAPTGAIARLESVRGIEVGVADNGSGFRMDIIQAAQESINAAAEMEAGDGA